MFFAAYLTYAKRADGIQTKDWCRADSAWRSARGLLRKYLVRPLLTAALTELEPT